MSDFLKKFDIDVKNENGLNIFSGSYEDFLEINNYDSELEEMLNELQTKDIENIVFYGNFGNKFLIKKVNCFE